MNKYATLIDMTGQKVNRIFVLERAEDYKNGSARWLCKCDCGTIFTANGQKIRNGHTKSCGCFSQDSRKSRAKTHGESATRLFRIWTSMKTRCLNKNYINWKDYGGRGIKICDDWVLSYAAFRDWARTSGYSDNLSIDRIDNNGNYTPENCKWSTYTEQARNKRNNVRLSTGELAYQYIKTVGLSEAQFRRRIAKGMTVDEAAKTPKKR